MTRRLRRLAFALAVATALTVLITMSASASTGQIPLSGTGSPQTGDFTPSAGDVTQDEFPTGESEQGPDPYNGTISLSAGAGSGASVNSGKKAKSNPTFNFGFEGLNHYQQRYSRGGNQFSVEPPDQGMCAGNGYVVEAVNDVLNIYHSADGSSALPDNTSTNIVGGFPRNVNHSVDLNSFYGYPPAINRATGVRGQFVTDPTCIYDAQTQRFFVVVLTLESQASGPCQNVFSCVNHLDLAVSQTNDPTGSWNIYRIDLTNNGTEYFLSSNAADEAQKPVSGAPGTRTSNQLIVWTLSNTVSLNTASPAASLSNKILTVGQYGVPPKQQQPGSGTLADKTT